MKLDKKKKTILIAGAAAVVLAAAVIGVSYHSYRTNNVFVQGDKYPVSSTELDLRGTGISQAYFEELSGKLPECTILWDVPFQGKNVPSTTESLTVSSLTREDVEQLRYFPNLTEMDATQCRDYDRIMEVREKRPRCFVTYNVEIGSQTLPRDTRELRLASGESSGEELLERIAYLTELDRVYLEEPEIPSEQLDLLLETYPKIDFSWKKTVFGQKLGSDLEELDISGMKFDSLEDVKAQAAYLPNLKKLVMCNSGFDNDSLRDFRDQVRDRYKVVWNVQVGSMDLRTDITTFFPDRDHGKVRDRDTYNLRYCEDLICVDVGHLGFQNVDWVEGTPHLKYLIMSDGGVQDVTPLGQLQELEFLELFMCGVQDPSPLINCKALRDLNLCRNPIMNVEALAQMPWLEKLWVSHCPIDAEERQMLQESLPHTHIEFDEFYSTWGGWRDMPRYFDMRDVLGVPYMR